MPAPERERRRTRLWLSDHDETRWITWLATAGVLTAAVLAAIGGFPLDTPMLTHRWGWVEPTCGLTRGSTAIARGDFATAWRYNPASFLVMGFAVAGVARTAIGLAAHRWVNLRLWPRPRSWALAGVAFIALWLYQQTNAEFIINSRI